MRHPHHGCRLLAECHGRSPQALGYLTIWPTGEAQPVVSTMNSPDGRVKANAAIVPAGYQGAINVLSPTPPTSSWTSTATSRRADRDTYEFYPLTPCRVVDTRNADRPPGRSVPARASRRAISRCWRARCIPPESAESLFVQLHRRAASRQAELGYLTVWPKGESQPTVSTLNNPTATIVANAAIVPAGTGGGIAIYAFNNTDLIVDINGYFAAPGPGGLVAVSGDALPGDRHPQVGNGRLQRNRVPRSMWWAARARRPSMRRLTCLMPRWCPAASWAT